ncbi:MAG: hypothetical protein WBJ81_02830 [Rickettsiales bacterium]
MIISFYLNKISQKTSLKNVALCTYKLLSTSIKYQVNKIKQVAFIDEDSFKPYATMVTQIIKTNLPSKTLVTITPLTPNHYAYSIYQNFIDELLQTQNENPQAEITGTVYDNINIISYQVVKVINEEPTIIGDLVSEASTIDW